MCFSKARNNYTGFREGRQELIPENFRAAANTVEKCRYIKANQDKQEGDDAANNACLGSRREMYS